MKRLPGESEEEFNRRHDERMARRKEARDRLIATKTIEKGLLIVHTGNGKGKSTAALGLVLRALGHGHRVGVVQFVKGRWRTGERAALESIGGDRLRLLVLGEGFSWESRDRARDVAAARAAWASGLEMLRDPGLRLVVLDELNIALRSGQLPLDEVLAGLASRAEGTHAVATGRSAPPALLEAADLATEMTLLKHPFRAGVKAQPGIEF